ncbi:crotonase/enoyl-CoA hydratase family protein [Chelativorans sp. J32]|uniref:crotonase/enoyl-CoA hydratase family protein n=1 Tax=Chelativorans sp. J32 TaxID=935840 RepID=UPI0004BB71E7|nr:crotonase/enoyl-CoA hydratase family protein [Chelativorans sp. J32]
MNFILFDQRGDMATLTLNRPEKLNALSYALIDELLAALDRIETDRTIRAVILTGAGRAFSAGGDIPEFADSVAKGAEEALQNFVARGQRLTSRIEAFPKPLIVAVNGLAYGGGCEITEAAPLSIAAESAVFAKPEILLGMPPTFGGTQRLPRLAGRKRAMELLLTGAPFPASRALELGLVNAVVPDADLQEAAADLAGQILRHSSMAIAAVMSAVTRGLNQTIAEGLLVEASQFARMVPSRDLREGLSAWRERRRPEWRGE